MATYLVRVCRSMLPVTAQPYRTCTGRIIPTTGAVDISVADPEIYEIMREEKERQRRSINLIASENYASKAVLQSLGSCVHNKTSEGTVGNRYYGSCQNIDKVEKLCKDRALEVYRLDPELWGVNVQVLSGSIANLAVYKALLKPHGRLMGLHLPDGGHLTHGYSGKRQLTASSAFFSSMSYRTDQKTGLIDYDQLHDWARGFKPNLIIAGISCYPRHLDYRRFREIADDVGAYLLADMAHISGLVAAGIGPNPFDYCHVVTTTTYKSFRGPRSAMVFYLKESGTMSERCNLERAINEAIFPGTHGAPHNHAIAALAVALKEMMTPDYKAYQDQAVANCAKMAGCFTALDFDLVTGGTDINMILVNLRSKGIDGRLAQHVFEHVGIDVNMNTCPGDLSPLKPSGIRLGTSAITSRGITEGDIEKIVSFLDRGIHIAKMTKGTSTSKVAPSNILLSDESVKNMCLALKEEVESFASSFPMPGMDQL